MTRHPINTASDVFSVLCSVPTHAPVFISIDGARPRATLRIVGFDVNENDELILIAEARP